jgi:hypothetical protein
MALISVAQHAAKNPGLTEASIRWDLFNRNENGLAASGAVINRGRRILIDPELYDAWLRTGQKPINRERRRPGSAA